MIHCGDPLTKVFKIETENALGFQSINDTTLIQMCLFSYVHLLFSGLPQYFVSKAKDSGDTEGQENSGKAGVEKAELHRA